MPSPTLRPTTRHERARQRPPRSSAAPSGSAAPSCASRVGRLAHALAARGIGQGDPVALVLPNAPAFVDRLPGDRTLRAVAVPLNPHFKEAELAFCLRDCGVRAVITDVTGEPRVPSDRAAWLALRRLGRGDRRPRRR